MSGGRLTLGIGAGGDPADFTTFGETFESAPRVARLDEDAARLDGWLRADGSPRLGPGPVQEPRMPMWVGGARPGALRRAARYEGWIAVATGEDFETMLVSPDDIAARVATIRDERAAGGRGDEPFDVGLFAHSEAGDGALVAAYGAAGVTWWLESLSPLRGSHEELLARVTAGPAR